jgi:hypothetical protein
MFRFYCCEVYVCEDMTLLSLICITDTANRTLKFRKRRINPPDVIAARARNNDASVLLLCYSSDSGWCVQIYNSWPSCQNVKYVNNLFNARVNNWLLQWISTYPAVYQQQIQLSANIKLTSTCTPKDFPCNDILENKLYKATDLWQIWFAFPLEENHKLDIGKGAEKYLNPRRRT